MVGVKSDKIEDVQIIRGIAALMVVVDHTMHATIGVRPALAPWAPLASQFGRIGVLIFFVISGYIMVATSYDNGGPRLQVETFIRRRLKRIFPLYWVITLVTATLHWHSLGPPVHAARVLAGSIVFWPVFDTGGTQPAAVIGQAWTLYYEMLFYVVFSAGLILRGYAGLFACTLFFVALSALGVVLRSLGISLTAFPTITFFAHYITLLFVLGLGIGVMEKRYSGLIGRVPHPLLLSCLAIVVCLALFEWHRDTDSLPPADEAIFFLLSAMVVAFCVFGARISYESRVLAGIVLTGDWSYAIYLTHNLLVGHIATFVSAHVRGDWPSAIVAVTAALTIATITGAVVFIWVERPLVSWAGRLLTRPKDAQGS